MYVMWQLFHNQKIVWKLDMPENSAWPKNGLKVEIKCFFFISEFERAAKIRKIAIYRFLISVPVPEL